ncbi:hypothetical protein E2C01_064481 [Portunus trituberculatus]|uniref:Uncharacterized protein n=1 Tax=Portunus trituberculatus TaxID=210409 RepID=A0A5B7HKF7_PORTR|nr:hypothetical protein [Portunus trituberculatus]
MYYAGDSVTHSGVISFSSSNPERRPRLCSPLSNASSGLTSPSPALSITGWPAISRPSMWS